MKIIQITVLTSKKQADDICLEVDIPSGVWPYTGNLFLSSHVAFDTGEKYVREHFPGIPIKVINLDNPKTEYKFEKTEK